MGAVILLFFNGAGPVPVAITSDAFYRPASTTSADSYPGSVDVADSRRGTNDERVQ